MKRELKKSRISAIYDRKVFIDRNVPIVVFFWETKTKSKKELQEEL